MDWKKIVSGIAPTLATTLGGPLAGTAVGFLAKEFLGDENATEGQIEAAILQATPADLLKLRDTENKFKVEMKRLDIDLERVGAEDRNSARRMFEVNIWPQVALSCIFVIGYFGLLVFLIACFVDSSGESKALTGEAMTLLTALLGVLTANIPTIIKFWFGGSPQDAAQMDRIYNSVPKHG